VIELGEHRRERRLQVREVHDPARLLSEGASHVELHAVAVPVQPAALVAGGDVRQPVGCLEGELLEDLHEDSW
jgi:hypothetical protein